ncbi:MAG: serine hydrolase domain-containing protein [Alphaproteobacteria bacterium]
MLTDPKGAGLSPERLAHIDRFLQENYIDAGLLPGALTVVARRGVVAHLSPLGKRDLAQGLPVEQDTIFRIYSMTKPITAVAALMLVEEGLIALDDPVHRFIPEWRGLGVYQAGLHPQFQVRRPDRPMRVIDLFRHTSGLTYGFQNRTNVDAAYRALKVGTVTFDGTLESMVADLATLPLEFSPGTNWNYSVSTDVLGFLVQSISGKPLDVFFRERIFEPLGMDDTAFMVPDDKLARFAACYEARPDERLALYDAPETSPYRTMPSLLAGGGGLVSTATDYLAFCRMLLDGGRANGRQVLSPKTIELMTANHLPGGKTLDDLSVSLFAEGAFAGVGFGLGVSVTTDPAAAMLPGSVGEFSWGGLASTAFWVDPREALIVVFMTQLIPSTLYNIRRQLRTLVYSAITD